MSWIVTRSAPAAVPGSIAEWRLGVGESSVLALALQQPGIEVLIDDLAARKCARRVSASPFAGRSESYWPRNGAGKVLEEALRRVNE
jgi:hypothetical protein